MADIGTMDYYWWTNGSSNETIGSIEEDDALVLDIGQVMLDEDGNFVVEAAENEDYASSGAHLVLLSALLFSFCLATVLGNVLVVLAVVRERYLHTVTNYFITSLAVADCLVGLLVMPFSAAVEMQMDRRWIFGPDLCDVWHSFDVLASTASILNLCIISMDRYWAITDPFTYPGRMTPKRAACFIALVWVCSSVISFPAIAWWRAVAPTSTAITNNDTTVSINNTLGFLTMAAAEPLEQCVFTDDIGYLVFSSTVSFYGPLSVMVFTYYRIYRAAVAQSKSLRLGIKQVVMASSNELCGSSGGHRLSGGGASGTGGGPGENSNGGNGGCEVVELTLRIHRGGRAASDNRRYAAMAQNQASAAAAAAAAAASTSNGNGIDVESNFGGTVELDGQPGRVPLNKMNFSLSRKLAKIAKERKAAKTLGIVMGVFIACWLPFFVTNLLSAFCSSCIHNPERVVTVVTWLGWLNSGMNPVIYACWSRDFRRAFARILCGCCPRLFHRWKRHSGKSIVTGAAAGRGGGGGGGGNGIQTSTHQQANNASATVGGGGGIITAAIGVGVGGTSADSRNMVATSATMTTSNTTTVMAVTAPAIPPSSSLVTAASPTYASATLLCHQSYPL